MIQFADVLGKALHKPRLRELCNAVELSPQETKYFLLRCSDRLSATEIEDLHYISSRQQRALAPLVNHKLQTWAYSKLCDFSALEVQVINKVLLKYKMQELLQQ